MVTRWYRPLEVVIGLKYDEKIDVFATALIYLEIIHGKEIIQSETNMDQLHKLLSICGYPT
jgi:serine/threonine-protein kinase BUR1